MLRLIQNTTGLAKQVHKLYMKNSISASGKKTQVTRKKTQVQSKKNSTKFWQKLSLPQILNLKKFEKVHKKKPDLPFDFSHESVRLRQKDGRSDKTNDRE